MVQPYDLPLEELWSYHPPLTREEDFADFWDVSLKELSGEPLEVNLQLVDYPADGVKVYDLIYRGYGGAKIHAWYAVPTTNGPTTTADSTSTTDLYSYPGLVVFHGYNASYEGNIHDIVNWALHGYATLGMHVRGQYGSEDPSPDPHGHMSGWMTKGILDKTSYYYRSVYLDAVRAVEVLASFNEVNPDVIGVTGASQGGGLSIAVGALSKQVKVIAAEYPYLSHFRRAIDLAPTGPYLEINHFFRRNASPDVEERAMRALTYFDIMNLAPKISCPTLMSIGLVDEITPPSTVFAAYHHLGEEVSPSPFKELKVYRYFGHEPISKFQLEKLGFLRQHLKLG